MGEQFQIDMNDFYPFVMWFLIPFEKQFLQAS